MCGVLEISDFTVLKSLAMQGIGVTFVYAPVAQAELDAGSLASFTLQGLDIRRKSTLSICTMTCFWISGRTA